MPIDPTVIRQAKIFILKIHRLYKIYRFANIDMHLIYTHQELTHKIFEFFSNPVHFGFDRTEISSFESKHVISTRPTTIGNLNVLCAKCLTRHKINLITSLLLFQSIHFFSEIILDSNGRIACSPRSKFQFILFARIEKLGF